MIRSRKYGVIVLSKVVMNSMKLPLLCILIRVIVLVVAILIALVLAILLAPVLFVDLVAVVTFKSHAGRVCDA